MTRARCRQTSCVVSGVLISCLLLGACGARRTVHPRADGEGGTGAAGAGNAGGGGDGTGAGVGDAGEPSGGTPGGAGRAGKGGETSAGGAAGSGMAGRGGGAGATTGGSAGSPGAGGSDVSGGSAGNPSAGGPAGGGGGLGGAGGTGERQAEWATWPMPNVANSGLPNPAQYTDLGDGTLRDEVTGLRWRRVDAGRWQVVKDACEALGDGWRMPSVIELVSLVGVRSAQDAPLRTLQGSVWSASEVAEDTSRAWALVFPDGSTYHFDKASSGAGVCVSEGFTSASPHYEFVTVDSISAVRDLWTGLVWQDPSSTVRYTFAEAAGVCDELGSGWRAPSVKELQTLVDRRRRAPAIDLPHFPDTPSAYFWTSTKLSDSIQWLVDFELGIANSYNERDVLVRCVR